MKKEVSSYAQIFEIVALIPEGKVTTYGIIARLIGTGFSARVVGYALNKIDQKIAIPAHRVVNRNGLLTGRHHFNPPEKMQEMLEREGIKVVNHQIQNFKTVLWNPLEE
jgi:O-6-methylguanine DNA methyltransferase